MRQKQCLIALNLTQKFLESCSKPGDQEIQTCIMSLPASPIKPLVSLKPNCLYYNIFCDELLIHVAPVCCCYLFLSLLNVCSPKQMGVFLQVCTLQHYGLKYISCLGLHCPRLVSSKVVGTSRKWHYQHVRLGAKTLVNRISGLNQATHLVAYCFTW